MLNVAKISSASIYVLLFLPLCGSAFPAYIYMFLMVGLSCMHLKVKIRHILFVEFLFLFFLIKFAQTEFRIAEILFRYFFGWILAYYFFYCTGARIKMERLLLVFCCSVIVETILINTILPPAYWSNYPDLEVAWTHKSAYYGFFQRPYSVGCNATVSSSILCLMLFYIESLRQNGIKLMSSKLEILAGFTLILFTSGTGLFLYMIYWAYKLRLFLKFRNIVLLAIGIVGIVSLTVYAATLETDTTLSKISSTYLQFLWDFKSEQVNDVLKTLQNTSFIIGDNYSNAKDLLLWNDFALNDLLNSLGFVGILVLLLFSIFNMNRINWVIILAAILGLFHYGGIFSMVGQLIFSYSLLLNKKTIGYYAP